MSEEEIKHIKRIISKYEKFGISTVVSAVTIIREMENLLALSIPVKPVQDEKLENVLGDLFDKGCDWGMENYAASYHGEQMSDEYPNKTESIKQALSSLPPAPVKDVPLGPCEHLLKLTAENNYSCVNCQLNVSLYPVPVKPVEDESYPMQYLRRAIGAGLSIGYEGFDIDKKSEMIDKILSSLPPAPVKAVEDVPDINVGDIPKNQEVEGETITNYPVDYLRRAIKEAVKQGKTLVVADPDKIATDIINSLTLPK